MTKSTPEQDSSDKFRKFAETVIGPDARTLPDGVKLNEHLAAELFRRKRYGSLAEAVEAVKALRDAQTSIEKHFVALSKKCPGPNVIGNTESAADYIKEIAAKHAVSVGEESKADDLLKETLQGDLPQDKPQAQVEHLVVEPGSVLPWVNDAFKSSRAPDLTTLYAGYLLESDKAIKAPVAATVLADKAMYPMFVAHRTQTDVRYTAGDAAADLVRRAGARVATWIEAHPSQVYAGVEKTLTAAAGFLSGGNPALTAAVSTACQFVKKHVEQPIANAIATGVRRIVEVVAPIVSKVVNVAKKVWNFIFS